MGSSIQIRGCALCAFAWIVLVGVVQSLPVQHQLQLVKPVHQQQPPQLQEQHIRPPRQYPAYRFSSTPKKSHKRPPVLPNYLNRPINPYSPYGSSLYTSQNEADTYPQTYKKPPSITLPNGNIISSTDDGHVIVLTPEDVSMNFQPNGDSLITVPDGPTTVVDQVGVVRVQQITGTQMHIEPSGLLSMTRADGSVVKTSPDGVTEFLLSANGDLITVFPDKKVEVIRRNRDDYPSSNTYSQSGNEGTYPSGSNTEDYYQGRGGNDGLLSILGTLASLEKDSVANGVAEHSLNNVQALGGGQINSRGAGGGLLDVSKSVILDKLAFDTGNDLQILSPESQIFDSISGRGGLIDVDRSEIANNILQDSLKKVQVASSGSTITTGTGNVGTITTGTTTAIGQAAVFTAALNAADTVQLEATLATAFAEIVVQSGVTISLQTGTTISAELTATIDGLLQVFLQGVTNAINQGITVVAEQASSAQQHLLQVIQFGLVPLKVSTLIAVGLGQQLTPAQAVIFANSVFSTTDSVKVGGGGGLVSIKNSKILNGLLSNSANNIQLLSNGATINTGTGTTTTTGTATTIEQQLLAAGVTAQEITAIIAALTAAQAQTTTGTGTAAATEVVDVTATETVDATVDVTATGGATTTTGTTVTTGTGTTIVGGGNYKNKNDLLGGLLGGLLGKGDTLIAVEDVDALNYLSAGLGDQLQILSSQSGISEGTTTGTTTVTTGTTGAGTVTTGTGTVTTGTGTVTTGTTGTGTTVTTGTTGTGTTVTTGTTGTGTTVTTGTTGTGTTVTTGTTGTGTTVTTGTTGTGTTITTGVVEGEYGNIHGQLVDIHNVKLLNQLLAKALTNIQALSTGSTIQDSTRTTVGATTTGVTTTVEGLTNTVTASNGGPLGSVKGVLKPVTGLVTTLETLLGGVLGLGKLTKILRRAKVDALSEYDNEYYQNQPDFPGLDYESTDIELSQLAQELLGAGLTTEQTNYILALEKLKLSVNPGYPLTSNNYASSSSYTPTSTYTPSSSTYSPSTSNYSPSTSSYAPTSSYTPSTSYYSPLTSTYPSSSLSYGGYDGRAAGGSSSPSQNYNYPPQQQYQQPQYPPQQQQQYYPQQQLPVSTPTITTSYQYPTQVRG